MFTCELSFSYGFYRCSRGASSFSYGFSSHFLDPDLLEGWRSLNDSRRGIHLQLHNCGIRILLVLNVGNGYGLWFIYIYIAPVRYNYS